MPAAQLVAFKEHEQIAHAVCCARIDSQRRQVLQVSRPGEAGFLAVIVALTKQTISGLPAGAAVNLLQSDTINASRRGEAPGDQFEAGA